MVAVAAVDTAAAADSVASADCNGDLDVMVARADARAIVFGTRPFEAEALNAVMPGLVPGIHVFKVMKAQRRGWHRKSGLPDFRIKYCCKSGKPGLQ